MDICEDAVEEILDLFIEGNLWRLPKDFPVTDWAFCADVLEHIPEIHLTDCLVNILNHTRIGGFIQVPHTISEHNGHTLHLIVKPYGWWLDKLSAIFNVTDSRTDSQGDEVQLKSQFVFHVTESVSVGKKITNCQQFVNRVYGSVTV
jgi:hypothetical protein